MTWVIFVAALAGFVAGSIDEQPAAAVACGVTAIYFMLKLIGAVAHVADLMTGPTIPPPPADQAETVAEIPGEKSGPRTIDRRHPSKQRDQGAA